MSIRKLLGIGVLLLLLAGCSSDDDNDVIDTALIIGEWEASHHSKNPNYADTADMWRFTFNADGTGSGPFYIKSFRYTVDGNRVTLNLMNTESYYDAQTIFIYEIVRLSKNKMEWDEITQDHWQNNSMYLKFYRK